MRLTQLAVADLDQLWDFFASRYGESQADQMIDGIHQGLHVLKAFPEVGVLRPLVGQDIRMWSIKRFNIFYIIDAQRTVNVLRILHGKQDLSNL